MKTAVTSKPVAPKLSLPLSREETQLRQRDGRVYAIVAGIVALVTGLVGIYLVFSAMIPVISGFDANRPPSLSEIFSTRAACGFFSIVASFFAKAIWRRNSGAYDPLDDDDLRRLSYKQERLQNAEDEGVRIAATRYFDQVKHMGREFTAHDFQMLDAFSFEYLQYELDLIDWQRSRDVRKQLYGH